MPALNFKSQFATVVQLGIKTQTIRARRKYPIHAGDKLYLYTGMRTSSCRKLAEVVCSAVFHIKITSTGIKIDGDTLSPSSIVRLARSDGFKSTTEFKQFFKENHGLPFSGQLIEWDHA